MTYIIKYCDTLREHQDKDPIPINIVWTDNCPTQYRCRQNFTQVAMASSKHDHKPMLIHKFAQKYRFKGSWDATGKIVKQRILNNELKHRRCATAFDCYIKLKSDMTQKPNRKKWVDLLKHESNGDMRILKNTVLTTKCTHIGFATEKKQQYDELCLKGYEHVVFTDRQIIPDCQPIPQTLQLAQVQGFNEKKDQRWNIITSFVPCSCPSCRMNPSNAESCEYKVIRNINEHVIKDRNDKDDIHDAHGIRTLTCAMLRTELKERGLPATGLKADLIARLEESIQKEGEDEGFVNEEVCIGEEEAEIQYHNNI